MSKEDKSKYYRHRKDVYMDIYEDSDGNAVIDYDVEGKSTPVFICSCVDSNWANFIIKRLIDYGG
jgi:hypothetical protein